MTVFISSISACLTMYCSYNRPRTQHNEYKTEETTLALVMGLTPALLCHCLRCAELLVIKAELELMQGEKDESGFDLDKVRHLLDLCTGLLETKHHVFSNILT